MHELSLAASILEIACRRAADHARRTDTDVQITKVELQIGHLRQVVPSALSFSFELLSAGTPAEGAELSMESVPARGLCRQCGRESALPAFPLQCAMCGSVDLQITAGEELIVQSLELEEVPIGAHSY